MKVGRAYPTLEERILANSFHQEDGCWVWLGARLRAGYGRINLQLPAGGTIATVAHRASWQAFRGTETQGRDVHHVCSNRACVNPAHLELMGHRDNCATGRRKNGTNGAKRGKNGHFVK